MIGCIHDLKAIPITNPEANDAAMKVLVSPQEGWQDHVMRLIEVGPKGHTPRHSHSWPHINYVVEGSGELMIAGVTNPVGPGSYAYIPADTIHQFRNTTDRAFNFICIVPKEGHK